MNHVSLHDSDAMTTTCWFYNFLFLHSGFGTIFNRKDTIGRIAVRFHFRFRKEISFSFGWDNFWWYGQKNSEYARKAESETYTKCHIHLNLSFLSDNRNDFGDTSWNTMQWRTIKIYHAAKVHLLSHCLKGPNLPNIQWQNNIIAYFHKLSSYEC